MANYDPYVALAKAIIFHGLMCQDPDNIVLSNTKKHTANNRKIKAQDAVEFVKSEDFDYWCNLVGLNPKKMRTLTPSQAKEVYFSLLPSKKGRWIRGRTKNSDV